jgi:hypothetical protein
MYGFLPGFQGPAELPSGNEQMSKIRNAKVWFSLFPDAADRLLTGYRAKSFLGIANVLLSF